VKKAAIAMDDYNRDKPATRFSEPNVAKKMRIEKTGDTPSPKCSK